MMITKSTTLLTSATQQTKVFSIQVRMTKAPTTTYMTTPASPIIKARTTTTTTTVSLGASMTITMVSTNINVNNDHDNHCLVNNNHNN